MARVAVDLGLKSYNINIEEGIISHLKTFLPYGDKYFVITDTNVNNLYGSELNKAMEGLFCSKEVLTPGEETKNFQTVEKIITKMAEAKLTRESIIIAFGGGVVGDVAGFCASIYMRGISFVQIPTTLLAQVDSSVGGKTGVNITLGKNLAGTFYQPKTVIIDTKVLKTLLKREFIAGLAEVIKYGVIYDYQLLKFIRDNLSKIMSLKYELINSLIARCCEIKALIVGQDELDNNVRKILNFGHTIGHAVEGVTTYQEYLHGEAVLIGMYYESMMAKRLGLIDESYFEELNEIFKLTNISIDINKLSSSELVEFMTIDKKNTEGFISFILPTDKSMVREYKLNKEEVLALLG